ncbi:NADH-quinone oxidoreductase subunit NuoN [Ancylobacter pratisalsi]|uniref:NADH-quinone oxidoreductase subunit N n=1 Tax=Ancylobacter pratisalsi TaxID=1745854 RepID=A0A6P1YVR4_9HYPH|nr:NADH-quinone oxidoreductase subunit NuoN [Ancylobacter pratisalsi]QIB35664.1 NADH-quinone oxidoreductase subunit NuoN [Ancylobacter pratisalsi]
MMFSLSALGPALPELLLAVSAVALILFGAFVGPKSTDTVNGLALAAIFAALVLVILGPSDATLFGGSFQLDAYARFLKVLALLGAGATLAMSVDWLKAEKQSRFEFAILVLLSTLGMMILISAGDLLALYMGLELMSLALYVIAANNRDSVRSTEAGLKYFVLGALSSGMLLYGASLLYGFTGTINFLQIAEIAREPSLGLIFGIVFVFAGLCFKVSAVPFHMWTPDVYEGAPTPVTAFFAAAPKIAAMAVFVRVAVEALPHVVHQWQQIIVFVSIASMALGAFGAIGQRNIKRLMAYSSIGHMGFALVGLAAGTEQGVRGVLIYMTIYMAMTLGTFACILSMRRKEGMVENYDDLAGLARTSPVKAFMLATLMFSLAGIPPLAGFLAKYYVFLAAIEAGLYTLAVIGVLASVVGAFYYLRIVKVMYFDEPAEAFEPMPTELRAVLGISGLFTLLFFVYPAPLLAAASAAARALF